MRRFFVSVIVILIVFGCLYFSLLNTDESENKSKNSVTEIVKPIEDAELSIKETKIYAVWLTYSEISSLVKGKSEAEYRESLEDLFNTLKENKINTIFYQCRAFCDSFYQSDIFPVSKYITAEINALSFDPFKVFSQMGKEKGIDVHCWVNPYRVSYEVAFKSLPKNSPARELYKKDKNALIICEDGIFLNPAHIESQKLVLSGIREIIEKYQVSGIHFDDYFYPETEDINDEKLYKEYKKNGGKLTLEDWRRENVSALVSSVYSLVKAHNESLVFSISPSADIKKCKNIYYADVEKWCREEGFADYIIPQIYYGFQNEEMPFSAVAKGWETLAEKSNIKLICGLAPYKCGRPDQFAGTGENEWVENVNILSRQYEQIEESLVWQGFALFSYSYCFGENMSENSKKEIKTLLYMVE